MLKTIIRGLTALALAALVLSAASVGPAAEPSPVVAVLPPADAEQQRLDLARQEATGQAFAALYRRVAELQLTPDLRVQDFLNESTDIKALALDIIRRHATIGRPQTYSDGAVALQVFISIDQVAEQLKAVCTEHGAGGRFKPQDFSALGVYTHRQGVWACGESRGLPRQSLAGPSPVGWDDVGAFGRLRVRREATDNAHYLLVRRIRELRFSASRRLAEFIDSDPAIAEDLAAFVRARPAVGDVRYLPERVCEVDIGVEPAALLAELKSIATARHKGTEFTPDVLDGLSQFIEQPVIQVTGVAVPDLTPPGATAPAEEAVWTSSARALLPESIEDAAQARLLASRAAQGRCREQLRALLLKQPAPTGGDETKVAEWMAGRPTVARDIDLVLGDMRMVQSKDLADRSVEVTVELPKARFLSLMNYYSAKTPDPDAEP